MNKLPLAKSKDIVIQELGKEVLIYDLKKHKAFNLNETSAVIFQSCDGETTFEELKQRHKFTDDLIFLALDQLKKEDLLDDSDIYTSPFTAMTRRETIRRVGLATMIALPVIVSLVAPTAAMAQSGIVCNSCTIDLTTSVNCGVPGGCFLDGADITPVFLDGPTGCTPACVHCRCTVPVGIGTSCSSTCTVA